MYKKVYKYVVRSFIRVYIGYRGVVYVFPQKSKYLQLKF